MSAGVCTAEMASPIHSGGGGGIDLFPGDRIPVPDSSRRVSPDEEEGECSSPIRTGKADDRNELHDSYYHGKSGFLPWITEIKSILEKDLMKQHVSRSILDRLDSILGLDGGGGGAATRAQLGRDIVNRLDGIQKWLMTAAAAPRNEEEGGVSGGGGGADQDFVAQARSELEMDIQQFWRDCNEKSHSATDHAETTAVTSVTQRPSASAVMAKDGVLELTDDWVPTVLRAVTPVSPEEVAIKWDQIPTTSKFAFLNQTVPEELKRILDSNLTEVPHMTIKETMALECVRALVEQGMTRKNYRNYLAVGFFALYHAEELKVASWNIDSITLYPYKGNEKHHVMVIPGIVDGSPEVRKGDRLDIKYDGLEYEVKVMQVVDNTVYLEFKDPAQQINVFDYQQSTADVSVEFSVNDYVYSQVSMMLRGIPDSIVDTMFPLPADTAFAKKTHHRGGGGKKAWKRRELEFFDTNIPENPEQTQTVLNILNRTSKSYAYILFGPPGTGKTVTLVESIKQVWAKDPDAKILVAAPSNAAADLLAVKLLQHLPKEQLIRLNAASRDEAGINESLANKFKDVCKSTGKGFTLSKSVRVVVSTLITSVSASLRGISFTHIFVDEAGQATEPEVLISLFWKMRRKDGSWVLAGDPHQLGPVIQADVALMMGLDRSLLARLMTDFDIYKPDPETGEYDSRYVTKLVRNFRSHATILEVPSEKFYDSGLVACADESTSEFFRRFDWIKNPDCPIMFHGVVGQHSKDGLSPSLYNKLEIEHIKNYVNKLLERPDLVSCTDIGVICPYRRQVRMIKDALRDMLGTELADQILVGSTEQFQGQERRVMLISTVRSSTDQDGEYTRQLGFLVNPQRFNVSVTRARSLLIVIGDPYILRRDKCWGDYLEFAIERAAYVGDPIKSRAKLMWEKEEREREEARRKAYDAEQWEIRKHQIEINNNRAKILAEKCGPKFALEQPQEGDDTATTAAPGEGWDTDDEEW